MNHHLAALNAALTTSLLLGLVAAPSAHAQLNLTLTLDNPDITAAPDEVITIGVTLANDVSSNETFSTIGPSRFVFNGSLLGTGNPYEVGFLPQESFELGPGDTVSFPFLTLTPNPSPAPAGFFSSLGLGYDNGQDADSDLFVEFVRSSTPLQVTVVPEPASVALLGAGSLLAFRGRRRTRA